APGGSSVIDPVCGMTVNPATAKYSYVHGATTYFFCGAGCKDKFATDPAGWLARGPKGMAHTAQPLTLRGLEHRTAQLAPDVVHPAPRTAEVEYTCPMHP